jgi:glycosyltransferase involved in cell wall biosynthesis
MQLLIVSDTLAGGMGALARTHAGWFGAGGWDVTLAAPLDGAAPDAGFAELPAVVSLRRVGDVRRARAALRDVWRACGSPPVVHAHGMRSFMLCRLAGLPKPFVSVHGSHPSHDDPPGYDVVRRAWFALLPRLARGATSGEPTSVRGWTYYPFASPMLGRVGELPFPAAESTPTVAWLGLLDSRKQPDVFVRAIAQLAVDGVAVRGVMGGAGERFDEIKALVASLGAPVDMLGQTDPIAVLRDAWVLALFSRSEGTPLVVMEAMWVGRSVVASNLPGNAHLIGDTGALADDVDAAAAALRAVVTDHAVAAARGAAAATRVRSLLTPDTPWAELEQAYRR